MDTPDAISPNAVALRLGVVLLLVLANGFFVAAEFALVATRRSRIDQLAAEGDKSAQTVQAALRHLDRYISGTQLGITLASLALGWIGEPALATLIDHGFAVVGIAVPTGAAHTAAAVGVAFAIITFLHIVLGELAPKSMALAAPERVSRWVARPLMLFSQAMTPFIWLLNGSANALLRMVGVAPASEASHVHSPEELRLLVQQASVHGSLSEADHQMIAGVIDFHRKRSRDVMRPRTEVRALPEEATHADVLATVRREQYSRYPVYHESLDDIRGVFLAKDLLLHEIGGDGRPASEFVLANYVRPVLYVPDSRLAELVLDDLRKTRAHMAVVLDEFGGTAGVVTMEDLVEEVIGDISDEHDVAGRVSAPGDVLELDGTLSLVDARSDYELDIPEGSWATLGGYVFARLGRLPELGDRVSIVGGELEVASMDGRRIATVRVYRV